MFKLLIELLSLDRPRLLVRSPKRLPPINPPL